MIKPDFGMIQVGPLKELKDFLFSGILSEILGIVIGLHFIRRSWDGGILTGLLFISRSWDGGILTGLLYLQILGFGRIKESYLE